MPFTTNKSVRIHWEERGAGTPILLVMGHRYSGGMWYPIIDELAGEYEGRAAFFDLSVDGRWGGVITGDRISIDFSPCACGAKGPSVRDNIVRYADLEGDDKIGCAGTVDAYVRGVA